MPRLEKWSIGVKYKNEFLAPELHKKYLYGEIYDDEQGRFEDGKQVSTSSIQELNLDEGYAMTRNTKYILGKPDEGYVEYLKREGIDLKNIL